MRGYRHFDFEGMSYDWKAPRKYKGAEPMRTPESHPYGYDSYYIVRPPKPWNRDSYHYHEMDSDRMAQSDSPKHHYREAIEAHCKGSGYNAFYNFGPEQITAFLQTFFGKKEIQGVGLVANCNQSNGYPYFTFQWFEEGDNGWKDPSKSRKNRG